MKKSSSGNVIKDIYGREVGRLVGIVLELNGSIKSIGVAESGGRFIQYPGDRLVKDETGYLVVPDWKTEAQRLAHQKKATRKREHALEELASNNTTSPRILEDLGRQIEEIRSSHDRLKKKIEARLAELESEDKTLGEFVAMAKLQFATAEIDENVYRTTTEYGRVALLTDEKEKEELRRAIGFIEDIEETPERVPEARKVAPRAIPEQIAEPQREARPTFIDQPFPEFRISPSAFRMPEPIKN